MTAWICATCGVQYPDTEQPPPGCPICSGERQYVGWDGQQWTTMPELAQDHVNEMLEEEPDLIGLGVTPSFGIGQRALLVRTPAGNVLWDCVSLLDAPPRERIRVEPVPGVTVARIGGHFDGGAVLHWPAGSENRGALLTRPPSRTSPAAWSAWNSTASTAAGGDAW